MRPVNGYVADGGALVEQTHEGHWECEIKDRAIALYEANCFAVEVFSRRGDLTPEERFALLRLRILAMTEERQPKEVSLVPG